MSKNDRSEEKNENFKTNSINFEKRIKTLALDFCKSLLSQLKINLKDQFILLFDQNLIFLWLTAKRLLKGLITIYMKEAFS